MSNIKPKTEWIKKLPIQKYGVAYGFNDITVSYTHLTLPTNREV